MTEKTEQLQCIRDEFIASAGNLTQSLGAGRNIGQVFAFVYLNPSPSSLQSISETLCISKGSTSMVVRQLEHWGALKKVWVKGDRKDYYEASVEFGAIIRTITAESVNKLVQSSEELLSSSEQTLSSKPAASDALSEEWEFVRKRIGLVTLFRKRALRIWKNPIFQRLLKS